MYGPGERLEDVIKKNVMIICGLWGFLGYLCGRNIHFKDRNFKETKWGGVKFEQDSATTLTEWSSRGTSISE